MKKSGLYDQYRYPNRLYISTETFDTRGNEYSLGSGMRGPPSTRGGSSVTGGIRSNNTSTATGKIPLSNTASSFDMFDDAELIPSRRRVSSLGWGAFGLQIFSMLLAITVFLGPGWGRSKTDARTDQERGFIHNFHGFWFLCTELTVGKGVTCINNLLVDKEGWWIAVQALGCVFLLLTFVCLLLICVYIFRLKSNRKWKLSLTYALVSTLNCMTMASCIILFAVNFLDKSWWCCPSGNRIIESILFWAWYLAVVALLAQLVATGMSIAETVRLRR